MNPASQSDKPPGTPLRCAGLGQSEEQRSVTMGLLMIDQIELAIPTEYLWEAIDFPPVLCRILTASPHVAGVVDVRGDLIPVVDLRHALALPPCDELSRRIVIIHHRDYLFGVVVDALGGVISVPASSCQAVEVIKPHAPPLIRQVLSIDHGARIVSVLCLDGVINQIDVPLTRLADRTAERVAEKAVQRWSPYVLFECGQTRLAINADCVDTVLNIEGMSASLNRSDACLGVIHSDRRRLAVLDVLKIVGLGETDLQNNRQILVLKTNGHLVGLLVKQVTQIARMDDSTRRAVPSMAFSNPDYFDGMLPLKGHGEFLKIDAPTLLASTEVSAMAAVHGRPLGDKIVHAQTGQSPDSQQMRAEVYLTFHVGGEKAASLKTIREILPLPQDVTPIQRPGDLRIGIFTHRDQVLPIIDMAMLMDAPPAQCSAETRLLLVDGEVGTIAFQVERVHAIEHAQWTHEPIAQTQWHHADELQAAVHAQSLLTLVADDGARRGVPSLDLRRIARAIEHRYQAAAPASAAVA